MWASRGALLPGARASWAPAAPVPAPSRPAAIAGTAGCRRAVASRAKRSTGLGDDGADAAAPKRRGRTGSKAAAEADAPDGAPGAASADTADPTAAKRRGRKTKDQLQHDAAAEAHAEAAAAVLAGGGGGAGSDDDDEEAGKRPAPPAPAEGPGSWAEAAANTAGEEDRRRFPYHRRLHTAAGEGNVQGAEAALASMTAAGMPPGPRAYHVLLCAHLKAGDLPGALGVTGRATEAGVPLLPESYAALIFSHMELDPPDVDVAQALFAATAGTATDPQLPWAVLCRLLAAKGFAAQAAELARRGIADGLRVDTNVGDAYVRALCDLGQEDDALKFLESAASRHGFTPEARHVTAVAAAFAAAGSIADAWGLVDAAGSRGWGRDAGSFNAVLRGLVKQLADLGGAAPSDQLLNDFTTLPARMVQGGVRPDKHTYALQAEGQVLLGDARGAMASVKSTRNAAGSMGCRLIEPSTLAALLRLLCEQDMPVDLLQVMVFMAEDGCRLPPGALAADAEGRSLLSRWVLGHMEGIAARAEARESAEAMLTAEIEYVNGVPIGPGRCAVDDDGLVVPVAKATIRELRAEAQARGVADTKDLKRAELTAIVKAARARLPFNVLKAQVEKPVASGGGRKATKPAAAKKKAAGRRTIKRDIWSIDERGFAEVSPAGREVMGADKFLLEGSALEDLDLTDEQWGVASNKAIRGVNFDAVMEARMLDEGTAAVMNVGDEDVTSGFATLLPGAGDDEDEDDEDEAERRAAGGREGADDEAWRRMESLEARGDDAQTLQQGYAQLQFLESQQIDTDEANLVAGMDVALDIVRAAEALGGHPTPADVLALAAAAQAERSPAAAAGVAPRLSLLLRPGAAGADGAPFDAGFVLQQYEALADACLRQGAALPADAVLEAAEAVGLSPSEDLMRRLRAALRGRPRRSERLGVESALLERAGVDTGAEEDLELQAQLQQQQQQQQQQEAAAAALPTDVDAMGVDDRPLDQAGAAGRPQGAQRQEQQQGEQEEEEEEQYPEELRDVMRVLAGISVGQDRRELLEKVLTSGAGLSPEDAADLLTDPMVLLSDTHWVHEALLTPPNASAASGAGGSGSEAAGGGQEGAGEAAQEQEQQPMTLLELAHACAADRISPGRAEWLLSEAERLGLPLMLDESTGALVWPGTKDYEQWAEEAEEEEVALDLASLVQAAEEAFGGEMRRAEQLAEAMMAQFYDEDGNPKPLGEDEDDQMRAMHEVMMDRLTQSGLLELLGEGELPERARGVEGAVAARLRPDRARLDADRDVQRVVAELGPQIEAERAALDVAELERLGAPVQELRLGELRGSGGGGAAKQLAAGGGGE